MSFKQNADQLNQVFAEFEKKLLKQNGGVLHMQSGGTQLDERSNRNLGILGNYIETVCADASGRGDFSVNNLLRAVVSIGDQLFWETRPKIIKRAVTDSLGSLDAPTVDDNNRVTMQKVQSKEIARIVEQARHISQTGITIQNRYGGTNYNKSGVAARELAAEFARLTKPYVSGKRSPTISEAQALLAAIKQFRNGQQEEVDRQNRLLDQV